MYKLLRILQEQILENNFKQTNFCLWHNYLNCKYLLTKVLMGINLKCSMT